MRTIRYPVLILAILALGVLQLGYCASPSKPAPKPTLTLEQARAYVRETAPLVEKIAGRTFKRIPEVKLVTAEQIEPVLAYEVAPRLRMYEGGLGTEGLVHSTAHLLASALLGKYGTERKILYIVPDNMDAVVRHGRIERKYMQSLIELVVAHELTHALQDQELNLARMLRLPKSEEEAIATGATVEGHATFVQDRVADALGLGDAQKAYARSITLGAFASTGDPTGNLGTRQVNKLVEQVYLKGRDFVAWHDGRGGMEAVWRILAHPPKSTAQILNPETYSDKAVATVDYKAALKGLEKQFGDRPWTVINQEVGAMSLAATYASMDQQVRERIVANLDHAQALVAVDMPTMANVSIIACKDASIMPEYLTALRNLAESQVKSLGAGTIMKISPPVFSEFTAMKSDMATKTTFTITLAGISSPNTFVRVVRGRTMVEIYFQRLKLTDDQIGHIAETVFNRLPAEMVGGGK